METNESIKEKLEYIGLDLNNVPEKIINTPKINTRIKRNYNEKSYKVYKYVNISDIQIYLTPTHRIAEYTEKYSKALPLIMYLNPVTEEDMERHTEFMNMLKNVQIEEIEAIENEQKEFNNAIPNSVNYHTDYLWQIYYSDELKQYFILFPTKENEDATLFYIIKKQIENSNEQIYVPICQANYSNKYLYESEIADLENYLCFFTKEWPLIHEVFDKSNELSIKILGRTFIYDSIQSEYKVDLRTEQDSRNFYQLVKALFILETQLYHYYKFKIKIDKNGLIHFYKEGNEITFENLPKMIKEDYIKGTENIIKIKDKRVQLSKELKQLKKIAHELDEEYFEKEKQISTFLECKKTFFGKIKYYFKYKNSKNKKISTTTKKTEEAKGRVQYFEKTDIKEYYNLEELIKLYENLDSEHNETRNLEQDIEAMNQRIQMLKMKIKNANNYINDIDKHKKSIFDFWRFTNKDEAKQLNAGEQTELEQKRIKIKKAFNINTDMEDIGKQFDRDERKILDREDTDYIHIVTTEILEDLNLIMNKKSIPAEHLDNLKESLKSENRVKTIDIFGSIMTTQEKIKTLGNVRHRENEKNKFSILPIKENTTMEEYEEILKDVIKKVETIINKYTINIDIPVYKVGNIEDKLNVFYINPEEALKNIDNGKENLYKINLDEKTHRNTTNKHNVL